MKGIIQWALIPVLFSIPHCNGQKQSEIYTTTDIQIPCPERCLCFDKTVRCMFVALKNAPNVSSQTHVLDLRFNEIKEASPETFGNLTQLHTLLMNNNHLSVIQDFYFDSLVNLEYLYLFKNRIYQINKNSFKKLAKLKHLYLHYNLLESLNEDIFRGLVNLERLFLHNNRIKTINHVAFQYLNNLKRLRLDSNNLICDCDILWLIEMAQNGIETQIAGSCFNLNEQKGVQLMQANVEELSCHGMPKITEEPSDIIVEIGGMANFTCKVDGKPMPNIFWFHESEEIVERGRTNATSGGSMLMIEGTRWEDAGTYHCKARNSVGQTASRQARMAIIEGKLRYKVAPTDAYSMEGGNAVFLCEVESFNSEGAQDFLNPQIIWYKNGAEVRNSERFTLLQDGNRLVISEVKRHDEGEYVCQGKIPSRRIEAGASLFVQNDIPPTIKEEPKEETVKPGSEAKFSCYAIGAPTPTIRWTKDNVVIKNNNKYRIEENGTLLIGNVSAEDAGLYECEAVNNNGYTSARAILKVDDIRQKPLGDQFLESSYEEAQERVNKAYSNTIRNLFEQTKIEDAKPRDIFKIFRFPRYEGRNIAKISEIIEQTLEIIQERVQNGIEFNLTQFKYEDLLSPDKLRVLSDLSGCLVHRRPVTECEDLCFQLKYRTLDGTCNNLKNPMWGASLTAFRRELQPIYENGFNTPVGWSKVKKYFGYFKPNARTVSSQLLSSRAVSADPTHTHMLMQWGQFLDHDIDHALPAISTDSFETGKSCHSSCANSAPCFPIQVPTDDARIRHPCMEFTRSSPVCGSGATSVLFAAIYPREQINQPTSFIDGSQIYSSSALELRGLRNLSYPYGELRRGISSTVGKAYLPFSAGTPIDCRRNFSESPIDCFLAGDIRANEQVGLLAMHTLWFREHNRITEQLHKVNPHWDSDTLFYEARMIVGAMLQHITYKHWLPQILGSHGMEKIGKYKGYDPHTNPSISNVFATAAFRFGHTLINREMHRLNSSFQTIPQGHLPLHKAFFSPWRIVNEGGIDPILRGLFVTPSKAKKSKQMLNSDLTENLFSTAHEIPLDLAAINIQRGRDHALPGYNAWREFCNLSTSDNFDDLKSDISSADVRSKLRQLYGHPGNVDLIVGALLEDAIGDSKVGPTILCLLSKQFRDLRDGDRFWYENPGLFTPEQLTEIKQVSLGSVLCLSGDDIRDVTPDVFVLPQKQSPTFISCQNVPSLDLRLWADCCRDCREKGNFANLKQSTDRRFKRRVEVVDASYPWEPKNNTKHIKPAKGKGETKQTEEANTLTFFKLDKQSHESRQYDPPNEERKRAPDEPASGGLEERLFGVEQMLQRLVESIDRIKFKISELESNTSLKNRRASVDGIDINITEYQ